MKQKLNAKFLRYQKPTLEQIKKIPRQPVYIILDNVLDTYNIGAIFRLADAVAACEVIICGRGQTPPNIKIHRAAIGTQEWVPWRYQEAAKKAISLLRKNHPKIKIFAIEQSAQSLDYREVNYSFPLALLIGNESYGVSKEILELVDGVLEIPMWGFNISLNAMVSLAIVLWKAMEEN
ncbi:MAG: TrmH family RNA methyltransferase [Candidatus Shapirobacteria bacterium]|nr:TrmH family RNA methyltransferase [Candidatus Shapirobacteria bacterium]MDD5481723.1 TrmH family RNA methyltransferase [Candidatus Shapirobacteria bacterium]